MPEQTQILDTGKEPRNKILIGTPTLGVVRFEWAASRWGQIIPCNWQSGFLPVGMPGSYALNSLGILGCLTADAQNVIVQEVVEKDYEWLFFHEDDVLLPPDAFLRLNEYIREADVPVVSGLYYTKSNPSEPVVYRGRGTSFYGKWKQGAKVWVDGVPTGCLLVHGSILKLMYEAAPVYTVNFPGLVKRVHRVFESPRRVWTDPETGYANAHIGTSDLAWCDAIIKDKVLERSGWKKIARRQYPFLVDTNILCKHIDLSSGLTYPGKITNSYKER